MPSEPDVATAEAPSTTNAGACPQCGAAVVAGEAFCEACGFAIAPGLAAAPVATASADPLSEQRTAQVITLPPAAVVPDPVLPCRECGSTESADGYCNNCGARMPIWRDHYTEQPAPWAAGVCDRGIHHARNEDAMALGPADASLGYVALVVCDGVTSAPDSDVAALAASRAARIVLTNLPAELLAAPAASPALHVQRLCRALVDASIAAQAEAKAASDRVGKRDNPPSCTFAAAVVHGDLVAAGWVGDSRVYWLPDEGAAQQLSVDDSWATQQIRQGVAQDVAEADPKAHAITRWLGADSPDTNALCTTIDVAGTPGWLLVCSDGLWNYVSHADEVRTLVADNAAVDSDPLAIAEALVAFANAKGGHDNITAALARLPIPVDTPITPPAAPAGS